MQVRFGLVDKQDGWEALIHHCQEGDKGNEHLHARTTLVELGDGAPILFDANLKTRAIDL